MNFLEIYFTEKLNFKCSPEIALVVRTTANVTISILFYFPLEALTFYKINLVVS